MHIHFCTVYGGSSAMMVELSSRDRKWYGSQTLKYLLCSPYEEVCWS